MADKIFKDNIDQFRKQVNEYGRRLTDDGIKRASRDLSQRASNAVKRDFTKFLSQGKSGGRAGKTSRTGHLRTSVHPIVKNENLFGLATNSPYAAVHEFGHPPYVIYPKGARLLGLAIATGNLGVLAGAKFGAKQGGFARALSWKKGGKTIFARKVRHPGQKARHWMSIPMQEELQDYIEDQIDKLEKKLGGSAVLR